MDMWVRNTVDGIVHRCSAMQVPALMCTASAISHAAMRLHVQDEATWW